MTLDDVAARLDVPWRQLVREIGAEVERCTGRPARVADAPRRIIDDEGRLGELRDIVDGLEAGAPLLETAARWRAATDDLVPAEAEALDAALSETVSAARDRPTERCARRPRATTVLRAPRPPGIPSRRCAARPTGSGS